MQLVKLIQGTASWLDWRRDHVTASMAPVILGVSPYQTPLELYNNIVNSVEQNQNPAMKMGSEREEEARLWISEQLGIDFYPCVLESEEFPWMGASMDGMSIDGQNAIEIKWNNEKAHKLAKNTHVPDHHYPQLQHQMAVTGLDYVTYVSCWKDEKISFPCYRNQDYIDDMVDKELSFLNCIIKKTPPDLTEKDICRDVPMIEKGAHDFDCMCKEYIRVNEEIKALTEIKTNIQDYLKTKHGAGCTVSYSLKKSVVRGSPDYKKYFEEHEDLLQFLTSKPDTESWRITKN